MGATERMRPVSVLVIIVNYRTPELAVEAAAAVEAEVRTTPGAYAVIVDNASGDGSADRVAVALHARGFQDWCAFLAEPDNKGFAAGNNAALRWCREETGAYPAFAWLLNPDTIAEPSAMRALTGFLEAHADVGIAGSRCLEADGTVWPSAFRFPSLASELDGAVDFGPVSRLLGNPGIAPPQPAEPAPAEWVSGTSMIVRRAVIDRIGLMDEGYFLYFEETDYCARAAAAGFGIWTVPASRVVHLGGQSTGVTGAANAQKRRPRYWFASRARFLIGRYGLLRAHLANLLWLMGYPVGRLIARARGRRRDDPPHFWRDFVGANYGPGGIMLSPAKRAAGKGDGK